MEIIGVVNDYLLLAQKMFKLESPYYYPNLLFWNPHFNMFLNVAKFRPKLL